MHAEQLIQDHEERLGAVLRTVVDGIVTINPSGIIETFNPAAERIFGYAAKDVIGHNVKMLMPEPYRGEHDGYLHSFMTTGKAKIIGIGREVTGQRKDGSTFPMELAVSEMKVGGERLFTGIVRDITERKIAEQALRDRENRMSAIVQTVVDGIVTINPSGIIETFNPAAERIFGYAAKEVIGHNVKMLMPEPYRGEHDGYLHSFMTTGKAKIIGIGREVTGQRKDGSTFPMELAVSEMQVGGKRMFTGIVRDIASRQEAAQDLRDSELRFRSMVENAGDAIYIHDRYGRILDVNQVACVQTGFSHDELLALSIAQLDAGIDFSALREKWDLGVADPAKYPITLETKHRRKDGSVFPIEVRISLLPKDDDFLYVAVVRDITERKRVDQMKNEFVSVVSHELRTPLTSISGALGLLKGGALGELPLPAQEMVEMAIRNSQRLTHLINDLLDMEKIAAGKMDFDIRRQSIGELVAQSLEANQSYGAQRKVTFSLVGEMPDVQVAVDGNRLIQVLSNLLSNAAKFSPVGGRVEISVDALSTSVRVTVTDHGPGIPSEFRDRIFQKFAQADASSTRKKGGTGLGLAITRELVQRMGGQIGFDSVEGQGASFFVEFPLSGAGSGGPG